MKIKNSILLFFVLLLVGACIDRLQFDTGELNQGILVVDGNITDQPGPYVIKLFRSSNVDDILNFEEPFIVEKVTLLDDAGNSEVLSSSGSGIYQTKANGMRGVVGRKYSLRIELVNGGIVESTPDEMKPVGGIDSLYWEFESFSPLNSETRYGFRIFVDARKAPGNDNFVRWRYTGTYKVLTYPEFHPLRCPPLDSEPFGSFPRPCSGYVMRNGVLTRVGECTCCYCWVNDYESKPHLNDNEIVTDGNFKKVELGFVPFNEYTFSQQKYMVKVEQMSLTEEAFAYWKIYRDQKEGVSSLFQPSFGRARTNFKAIKGTQEVAGMFYASSVIKRILFINASDAPLSVPVPVVPPIKNCFFWEACDLVFYNSFTSPPPEWE